MTGSVKLGRGLNLGSLERAVLDVLWSSNEPLTVRDVHSELTLDRDLAYTTIMTVLYRLTEKGVLFQYKDGRAYTYAPVEGRAEFVADHIIELLAECGPRGRGPVLTWLVGRLGSEDAVELQRALNARNLASDQIRTVA